MWVEKWVEAPYQRRQAALSGFKRREAVSSALSALSSFECYCLFLSKCIFVLSVFVGGVGRRFGGGKVWEVRSMGG